MDAKSQRPRFKSFVNCKMEHDFYILCYFHRNTLVIDHHFVMQNQLVVCSQYILSTAVCFEPILGHRVIIISCRHHCRCAKWICTTWWWPISRSKHVLACYCYIEVKSFVFCATQERVTRTQSVSLSNLWFFHFACFIL
jgi:hypothetical protein